jgi:hypothetical protein
MSRYARRAALLPSAEWRLLRGGFERPKAEALGYPEAKTKARASNKGGIRGSLHCALDGETVQRFGRDDVCCGGSRDEDKQQQRQKQIPTG